MTDKISFVIRARDEERHIGYAVQSVIDFFGAKTHIVVVDNESADATLSVVSLFPSRFCNIEVINLPRKEYSPGKALNLGVSKTNTPVVGILSAHCEIRQAEREALLDIFQEPSCFAVCGKQIPIYQGKKITPRYVWSNFTQETRRTNPHESSGQGRYFFHNAFSFISRCWWNRGQFDEDLAGKEDRFWAEKMVNMGGKFYLDPSLECRHFWTPNGATWAGLG